MNIVEMFDRKFSLRIITCDYYQEKPIRGLDETYSKFRSAAVDSVPVIRIFGITPSGQKACLHVHGVFPYLTIPYHGQLDVISQYMQELALNIDNALNSVSLRLKKQHVYKIQLKKAIPYYGYHQTEQNFLQIFLYTPSITKKLVELLNSGTIMGSFHQPHEAHIPYILQFFIDYNLFGMNYIRATNVRFRIFPKELNCQPLTSPLIDQNQLLLQDEGIWDLRDLPPNMVLGENIQRQSTCELEVDCSSAFILNRLDESATSGNNPGLVAIWEDEKQRHRELFDNSKITPPVSQERVDIRKTTSEEYYLDIFRAKMKSIVLSQDRQDNTWNLNETHSQLNKSDSISEFLDIFQNILDCEESDSILSTQKSNKTQNAIGGGVDGNSSADESDDSLEMSQVFWPKDLNRDDDIEPEPDSSGSNLQLAQNEPASHDSRSASQEAGCSFWLPQLDGAFDKSDDNSEESSSVGLSKFSLRKRVRKSDSSATKSRRLSRSKTRPTSTVEQASTSTDQIVTMPKRVLRNRTDKLIGESRDWFSDNEIRNELPSLAADVILKNAVKISRRLHLGELKKLGTESVKATKIGGNSDKEMTQLTSKHIDNEKNVDFKHFKVNEGGKKTTVVNARLRSRAEWSRSVRAMSPSVVSVGTKDDSIVANEALSQSVQNLNYQMVDESKDNLFQEDALSKLSYMSPPKYAPEDILTPPVANSPTDLSYPNKDVSFISDADDVLSSDSENDITLHLETSDESDHSGDETIGKLSSQETSVTKINQSPKSFSDQSDFFSHSTSSHEMTLRMSLRKGEETVEPRGESNEENASELREQTRQFDIIEDLSENANSLRENSYDENTDLNTSVYSFANVDLTMLSPNESLLPSPSNKSSEVFDVLTAPPPPSRQEVEQGGFDTQKLPDSTSKIDKQGYSIDPNDLDEYEGTFHNALAKTKQLHYGEPPEVCGHEDVIITPLILPPKYEQVLDWCRKSLLEREENSKPILDLAEHEHQTPVSSLESSDIVENSSPHPIPRKMSRRKLISGGRKSVSPLLFESDKSLSSLDTIAEEPLEITSPKKAGVKSKKQLNITQKRNDTFSEIEGVTQNTSLLEPEKFDQRKGHLDFVTVMSLEVHCQTRESLKPNPKFDEIAAIFYCIQNQSPPNSSVPDILVAAIIVEKQESEINLSPPGSGSSKSQFVDISKCNSKTEIKYGTSDWHLFGCDCLPANKLKVTVVPTEKDLFQELVNVMKRWDPEIIIGYEVEMLSWGYVLERAAEVDELLCGALSRIPKSRAVGATRAKSRMSILVEDLDSDNIPDIKVPGRIILNVWKIMRKEAALTSYTFENVFYHISNKRVPYYEHKTLTEWFNNPKLRYNLLEHYVTRVCGLIELMDHFNIVGRTSELARIFGIQFFEVFSRGSQFRVESMMLRMVKAANFIAVSPSVQQRAHSRAPETLPLILEPETKFYTDPVLVLDFQSLYPSIIIAYNYCYSTCLGRVEYLGLNAPFEFGCTSLDIPLEEQRRLQNDVTISPMGIAFVKPSVRRGILPKMLQEILETRIMVKKSMKENRDNKSVVKLLDARQLGLKLIANVTYGYTAANFSGRMPCAEVADSILSKSRETLQNAINFVENNAKWGAHIVYGDTDSMFVRLPGRTKAQAFKIGEEIAEAVTALNPNPIKLKFEKVYLPCVLQTKKRYVGYMYETLNQTEPVFDAKGIETVRRDSCPAVGKILEKSLRLLFEHRDVNPVKLYVQRQLQKLLSERTNIQELLFAKEFRGINGYRAGAHHVPALTIARRLVHLDPRAEPRVGERVPYVIIYGEPGLPLIKLVRQPQELLNDSSLRINSQYYITRVIIPPLERVFCLLGVSVTKWLNELPRTLFTNVNKDTDVTSTTGKTSLPQYFSRVSCVICERASDNGLCTDCKNQPQMALVVLEGRINYWQNSLVQLTQICQSCTGLWSPGSSCQSLDCPVLFRLCQAKKDISQESFLQGKINICLTDCNNVT